MTESLRAKIEPGMKGSCERIVSHEWTLSHVDPEWPAIFTTPAMIGMMEIASSHAVRPGLPPGSITVGIRIEVDHLKPVHVGATVIANSKLLEIDGRRLIFEVEARSGDHVIGRGRVIQTIVEHARFTDKAKANTASR